MSSLRELVGAPCRHAIEVTDYGLQGFETPAATARMPAMTTDVPSAAPVLTNPIAALAGTRVRQPINNTIKVA